jgi:hypothetical protein
LHNAFQIYDNVKHILQRVLPTTGAFSACRPIRAFPMQFNSCSKNGKAMPIM